MIFLAEALGCIAPQGVLVVVGAATSNSASEAGESKTGFSVAFPKLLDFVGRREDLLGATAELFSLLQTNALAVSVKDKASISTN